MAVKRKDSKGRLLRTGESQRKSGDYQFTYYDHAGKRNYAYAWCLVPSDVLPAGKKPDLSLREKEKQILKDLEDGIYTNGMTLNGMMDTYFATKKWAVSTRVNYEGYRKRYITNSKLGNTSVKDIRKSQIAKFYKDISNQGYADASIRILHKIIYPSLELAVEDELIRKNPAKGCAKEYTESVITKVALTDDEISILLGLFSKRKFKLPYEELIKILLGTGCRIGEIMGLTWKDVNMQNKSITIDHGLLYRLGEDGKMAFYVTDTKTQNSVRTIPMTDEVFQTFQNFRKKRLIRTTDFMVDGYGGFVFTSGAGRPLYPAQINNRLYKVVDKYNETAEKPLPHISCHTFRHTACTRMVEAGMDLNTVRHLLGHGDLKQIMSVYDHVNFERTQKQMAKLNDREGLSRQDLQKNA